MLELIKRAQGGDEEALTELLEQHRGFLLGAVNQMIDPKLKPKIGCSDIVQESMMRAFQNFDSFEGASTTQFLGWLKKIAFHDVLSQARRYRRTFKRSIDREQKASQSEVQAGLVDQQMTPRSSAVQAEEEALLANAMKYLPDIHQEVLNLQLWQGKSYSEIAEILDRSPEAVRKLRDRALLKLHSLVKQQLGEA